MSYFAYCVKCNEQPTTETEGSFYDFRFDEPVCVGCVEEYNLEPDKFVFEPTYWEDKETN